MAGPYRLQYRRATSSVPTSEPSATDERDLLAGLRAGDEAAFVALLRRFGPAMLRVAMLYVPSRAVAEEVVQETWLAVLDGLDRFEGRSSLKTWIFRILVNRAISRGQRERRIVPFSALAAEDADEPAVDPDRFLGPESEYPGHWAAPPRAMPEERLLAAEARERVQAAIDALPEAQRAVITLRDVLGMDAEEAAELLEVSPGNQRVLLHRARAKVRSALEGYLEGTS